MIVRDIKSRILQDIKGSDRPSRILVFDTETKHTDRGSDEHHYLDFAWVNYFERDKDSTITRDTWTLYETTASLWEYIFSKAYKKSTLYVFGHNVYFDLQCSNFFVEASERGYKVKFLYDKGLVFILSIFNGSSKIKIISTTNFYDFSLDKIGKSLGIEKMKVNFDTDSREYKQAYCKNDVLITRIALLKYIDFLDEHNMGNFCMTKASQALTTYRYRFMKSTIYNHNEQDIIDLERESYLGGRNEAFELGDLKNGPFYHYDINSMYPFVMLKYKYPTRLIDIRDSLTIDELKDYLTTFCCIAEVELDTNEPIYGIRNNGKMIFPVGRIKTVLPTGSLKVAIEKNHIHKIGKAAFYECDYIFKDYIDYFYSLKRLYKEENNEIYTRIVKIFLNSLYGKFGQKNAITEINIDEENNGYYRIENYDAVTGDRWTETELLHTNIIETGEEEGKLSMVAIPSHVTDYARLLLWKLIDMVGYNNVLYCDTDSLKIREKDKDKINYRIDNYDLGALSLEDVTKTFRIYGCKDYYTEKGEKIKGVPKNYIRINDNTFQYKVFPRMNTHLRKQIEDHYIIQTMIKTNKRVYDKGIVDSNGRVHPLKIYQW